MKLTIRSFMLWLVAFALMLGAVRWLVDDSMLTGEDDIRLITEAKRP